MNVKPEAEAKAQEEREREREISMSISPSSPSITGKLDFLGGVGSTLCAIHCVALPFVLSILPAFGLAWIGSHTFGIWMIAFTFCIGIVAIIQGAREHGKCYPLFFFGIGILLLIFGECFLHEMHCEHGHGQDKNECLHYFISAFGGFTVALSHIFNRVLCHKVCHSCSCKHEETELRSHKP